MKVWEDTWTFCDDEDGWDIMGMDEKYRPGTMYGLDEAKLAAAAPEMARLLMCAEWEGAGSGGEPAQCPWCGREPWTSDERLNPDRHEPDCALVSVLRKAGVLPT